MSFDDTGFDILPKFEETEFIKPLINIGSLYDIPTGTYHFGQYGESILNGGLGLLTGVVGIGNNFKSTIAHHFTLTAASRFEYTKIVTYDTEMNIQRSRLLRFAALIGGHKFKTIFEKGVWQLTDRSIYFANKWYEKLKEFMDKKVENKKKFLRNTPFLNADKKTFIQWMMPTFGQVDSFSEFETEDVGKIQDENELGDSGGNTMHMRQGLAKIRFLSDVIKRASESSMPVILTAHVGKDIPMDPRAAPVKKLQFLKNGDKVKGVTDKFFFLTSLAIQCQNAAPLINRETKAAEYPIDTEDNKNDGDTDLNIVTTIVLRNKNGPTGHVIPLIVSQRDGVLPSLSEFHYIKNDDRYGFEGNNTNYSLSLCPEIKLSRTTIRSKLKENPKLRRAMQITSEMCQMKSYWRFQNKDDLPTPKQLFDDLISLGYDWDVLFDTRPWWTFHNDNPELKPFLTTMDLLRMRKGLYHPYWLSEDKKTVILSEQDKYKKQTKLILEKISNTKLKSFVEVDIDDIELADD